MVNPSSDGLYVRLVPEVTLLGLFSLPDTPEGPWLGELVLPSFLPGEVLLD
jgi:hypothetical protein